MIARTWHGWTTASLADEYQHHYATVVATELRGIPGFRGARLLRHQSGGEVRFTSITFFTDVDAIRAFAGDEYEFAVVAEQARKVLTRWDERVVHDEVAIFVTG
ncbi:antibiotic biosynthesis monooxygenase [Actinoplanes sp. LDG1-06]|uniref:Antibiotic biosynthesis monooxygenase n=1 Tax=Paractinoplanes ovalisporus TaxID=2810368 RepID=A0ABS2AG44_9ACTN|nr:antibiotic biosynthesis monooxygenase [Actinoplanes ovalisporus]MBM2618353.1 antibiotic biosynthesis monooxygenase [Actinoplanes ovalisporus]